MAVLCIVELSNNGGVKKSSLEAVCFAKKLDQDDAILKRSIQKFNAPQEKSEMILEKENQCSKGKFDHDKSSEKKQDKGLPSSGFFSGNNHKKKIKMS